jgi:uncharacterized OsmC-like protein
MLDSTTTIVNGIDLKALDETVDAINKDAGCANVQFRVKTDWLGQTRSESTVDGYRIGGQEIARGFKIVADEPHELLGADSAPNPQELLMSAVNACMMVGYVAQASIRGIRLDSCTIETEGELDLRGFLGLDETVPNGYRRVHYRVTLKGDGTAAQYEDIHQAVMATSPNYFNMTRPVEMCGTLCIG